jgi:hypothetical protein
MKTAVIGSRKLMITNLEVYLPADTTEIVSGGATGIDTCAKHFSLTHNIPYTEYRPDYTRYGRAAPIVRNRQIVDHADRVIAFWDGTSRGTRSVIDYCRKIGKPLTVYTLDS